MARVIWEDEQGKYHVGREDGKLGEGSGEYDSLEDAAGVAPEARAFDLLVLTIVRQRQKDWGDFSSITEHYEE